MPACQKIRFSCGSVQYSSPPTAVRLFLRICRERPFFSHSATTHFPHGTPSLTPTPTLMPFSNQRRRTGTAFGCFFPRSPALRLLLQCSSTVYCRRLAYSEFAFLVFLSFANSAFSFFLLLPGWKPFLIFFVRCCAAGLRCLRPLQATVQQFRSFLFSVWLACRLMRTWLLPLEFQFPASQFSAGSLSS